MSLTGKIAQRVTDLLDSFVINICVGTMASAIVLWISLKVSKTQKLVRLVIGVPPRVFEHLMSDVLFYGT